MVNWGKVALLWGVFVLISGAQVAEAIPVVTGPTGSTAGTTVYNGSIVGWEFDVNSAITVTALGVLDAFSNGVGLAESHQVGIWSASGGSPLASVTVLAGNPGTGTTVINDFHYVSISPLLLASGSTYVIGAHYVTGYDQVDTVTSYTSHPSITVTYGRYGSGFTYPGSTDYTQEYFGPNFTIQAIPEPTTFFLLGFAILGLMGSMHHWKHDS